MKQTEFLKSIEYDAEQRLRAILAIVPELEIARIEHGVLEELRSEIDIVVYLSYRNEHHRLFCEVKSNGQPRIVRGAAYQLLHLAKSDRLDTDDVTPVIVAPYLSPAARDVCRDMGICYLDFEGNCWLQFGTVFIDHRGPTKAKTERRELRSIFAPKSAQVIRCMIREPYRAWRLADLAQVSKVSIGHVSNIKRALIDQEWAESTPDGLRLIQPDALLDEWRDAYAPPHGRELSFHTILHGSQLKAAIGEALRTANDHGAAMLASFSAADWLAPYARTPSEFFYADEAALRCLREKLDLRPVEQGGNIKITVPDDHDLFLDKVVPAAGITCTSPVQTFLDMSSQGSRGVEAADHLRRLLLKWNP